MVTRKLDKEPIVVSESDVEIVDHSTLETLINEIEGTHSAMEMLLMRDRILFQLKKALKG